MVPGGLKAFLTRTILSSNLTVGLGSDGWYLYDSAGPLVRTRGNVTIGRGDIALVVAVKRISDYGPPATLVLTPAGCGWTYV